MLKKIISFLMCFVFILIIIGKAPISSADEKTDLEVLNFVKEYIDQESKNTGIFTILDKKSGSNQWFELVGILKQVIEKEGFYRSVVDVNEFGYDDQNYLIYFDIKNENGQYKVIDTTIAVKHKRQSSK